MTCVKMNLDSKIYVAGHSGLVGSALVRVLRENGYRNLIYAKHKDVDLCDEHQTKQFFEQTKPDYVFLAAAKCGGIGDTKNNPVQYLEDNLKIQTNVISSCHSVKVKKMIMLGSASVYPAQSIQPIKEEYLLTGNLEPVNESYGMAKILGTKLCQAYNKQYGTNFITVNPCNVYGPKDNFNPSSSHVVAALLRRFHEAKLSEKEFVECWGTGNARRELIYVEDLADALIHLMKLDETPDIINVGPGKDVSIRELVAHIVDVVGYEGEIRWDETKPEGVKQRLLDVSKINDLGWSDQTSLDQGLFHAYEYFKLGDKK